MRSSLNAAALLTAAILNYEGNREEIAALIRRYVQAAPPALDMFFRLTLFNYLVSNGDAHLKDFSLYRLPSGEYYLTTAYDMLNTSLHVDDGNGLALDLFADDFETPSFAANAYLAYDDFLAFGLRIGCRPAGCAACWRTWLARRPPLQSC